MKFPPGPSRLSDLQVLSKASPERLALLERMAAEYGDIVHARFLGQHYYLLNHPDLVRAVLVEQADHVFSQGISKRARAQPSAVVEAKAFHRWQRKLIQPAFQPARLAIYGEAMTRHTQAMLDSWKPGETRDLLDEMTRLTLRIIAETLFGAEVEAQASGIGETIRLGQEYLSEGGGFLPSPRNLRLLNGWMTLTRTTKAIIAARRAAAEDRGDVLSMILLAVDEDDGSRFNEEQAHAIVTALFIAGHETTSTALAWTWLLLAESPDAEARLYAELDAVLGGRAPTAADLDALPYTEAVLRESMRLRPPAWVLTRRVLDEFTLHDYVIPKAALLFISPYLMHRDARFFDAPERFAPERWLDGLDKRLPRFAYFPFGGGAHVCTGQFFAWFEARLILAAVAQRWRLRLVPNQSVQPKPMITLRPDRPILMTVEPR